VIEARPRRVPLFGVAKGSTLIGGEETSMPRSSTRDVPTAGAHTPNRLDVALGLRIRQRRKALSLSQTGLADAIGVTFQQIQKYERGFNRVSFSRLVDIAHALDCRVIDLVGDLDDDGSPSPLFRQDTSHLRETGAPALLAAYSALPGGLQKVVVKLMVELVKARSVAFGA
jgi:transcriptional regulator with XRE-family HTH domain